MDKEDLLNSYEEYYYCMKNIDKYDKKYYWFCEKLLEIETDDNNLSIELGKELYELCYNIHINNQKTYYSSSDYNMYKKSIIYKNLIERCGIHLECGTSYRFAWFDYFSKERLIDNEETMDWLLNEFMKEMGTE